MAKNSSWDSVANSRRSRIDENSYITNLAACLPFCYKSLEKIHTERSGTTSRFIGIDGPKKLPTLRYAVSFALKQTLLMNILGIENNQSDLSSGDQLNEHLGSLRSDHDQELLIVFDPSNFYLEQHQKPASGRRSSRSSKSDAQDALIDAAELMPASDDLLESGKLIYVSENCENFLGLPTVPLLAKYESVYELMPIDEAKKLANLVECLLEKNSSDAKDGICLCSFKSGIVTEGKFSFNGSSMPALTTVRILRSETGRRGNFSGKPLVAIRCRPLTPVVNNHCWSFKCDQNLVIQETVSSYRHPDFEFDDNNCGQNWLTLINPDYLQQTIAELKTMFEEKKTTPVTFTTRLINSHNKSGILVQIVASFDNTENNMFLTITCRPLPEDSLILSELEQFGNKIVAKGGEDDQTSSEPQQQRHQKISHDSNNKPKRQKRSSDGVGNAHESIIYHHQHHQPSEPFINSVPPAYFSDNYQHHHQQEQMIAANQQQQQQQFYYNQLMLNFLPSPADYYYQAAASGTTNSTAAYFNNPSTLFDHHPYYYHPDHHQGMDVITTASSSSGINRMSTAEWACPAFMMANYYRPPSPNSSAITPPPISLVQAVPESSYTQQSASDSHDSSQDAQEDNKVYAKL